MNKKELEEYIPSEVLGKLWPYINDIPRVLSRTQDIAHSDYYHSRRMVRLGEQVAQELRLPADESAMVAQIGENHDLGYQLMGILEPNEHEYGSFVIALARTGDIGIAKGCLLHNADVLPEESPRAIRIVRDIDRYLMGGTEGALRWSMMRGFRPWGKTKDELLKPGVMDHLYDDRLPHTVRSEWESRRGSCMCPPSFYEVPVSSEYESKGQDFTWKHIIPFLESANLISGYLGFIMEWFGWIDGVEDFSIDDPDDNYDHWLVEPVSRDIAGIFENKWANTKILEEMIHEWMVLKQHEDVQLEKWNSGLPTRVDLGEEIYFGYREWSEHSPDIEKWVTVRQHSFSYAKR